MSEQTSAIPDLPMDEFIGDPWGSLDRAREAGAVGDAGFARITLTHELAHTVLKDRTFAPNFAEALEMFGVSNGAFYEWMKISPLNNDGDDHKKWRAFLSRAFTPRNADQLRPFLTKTANELIDGFDLTADGEATLDFVDRFSHHYPLLALCELIGVPSERRAQFADWADAIGMGFNPMELPMHLDEVNAAVTDLVADTGELIAARRRHPGDDLVTRVALTGKEEGYTDYQLAGFIAGLVFAGHETTKMQLGWMVSLLAEHPGVWDRVAAEPELAPRAVDEVMRLRSAATAVGRKATEDVELAGCPFRAGDRVLVSLWGANNDPAAYGDNHFELDEDREPHVAFGYGAHYCLGAGLAKAELQVALITLTQRLHPPVLADGAVWRPPIGINGPSALPVTFRARGG